MNQWLAAAPDSQVAFNAARLQRVAQRPVRSAAAWPASDERRPRPRRPLVRMHPDPARAPRLGGAGAVRRDHPHPLLRRPVHPDRRRPGPRPRRRPHRGRPSPPRTCSAPPASPPTRRRRCDGSPTSSRVPCAHARPRLRRRLPARRCSTWPTPTRPASAPRASRRRRREHHPDQRCQGGDDARDVTTTDIADVRPIERPEATSARRGRGRPHGVRAPLADRRRTGPDRPTAPLWDVRAMAGHVLGMTETFSALGQVRLVRCGPPASERATARSSTASPPSRSIATAGLSTGELIDRLEAVGPVAARWRASRRLMRHIPIKEEIDGAKETWKMGYARRHHPHPRHLDAPSRHRQGHRQAHGAHPRARRPHRRRRRRRVGPAATASPAPCTSPVRWAAPSPRATAARRSRSTRSSFCRILSGRGTGEGLLAQQVPF